ncbi:MAG: NAD-dependent epimerase/dehydratase family protein [Candidatus Micrarchaeota archaeon]|nr:NAD-dependent epimerase/dehydratase family protein [Candidatus Micrarchaeota archaeon]
MRSLITGGAGFIGSHLAEALIARGDQVDILDNFSAGKYEISGSRIVRKDIRDDSIEDDFYSIERVFHLAAAPDVKLSLSDPNNTYYNNVEGTFKVLEFMRKKDIGHIIFTSTSAVYGNAKIPTSEEEITAPISNYAASKLSGEAFISAYSSCYGIKATVLRYANIFGERSTHGVMFDFYNKLMSNPDELEILGDGNQEKSYLYIKDCIDATILAAEKQTKSFDIFNIGTEEKIRIRRIAELLCSGLGLSPQFKFTGSEAWKGDVKLMLLDISKIKALGFSPKYSFEKGLDNYIRFLKTS